MKPALVRDAESRKLFEAMTAVRQCLANVDETDTVSIARLCARLDDLEFYAAAIRLDLAARRAAA